MSKNLDAEKIRQRAKALDDAIEKHNVEEIMSCFSEDCEIEMLGIKLKGKDGLRKAIDWMYRYLGKTILLPITIIIEGNTFFLRWLLPLT